MPRGAFVLKIQRELCRPKSFGIFEKQAPGAHPFIWKLVFIHMQMKINFHMKGWAPGLAMKKRLTVIRKWPILMLGVNSSPKRFLTIESYLPFFRFQLNSVNNSLNKFITIFSSYLVIVSFIYLNLRCSLHPPFLISPKKVLCRGQQLLSNENSNKSKIP